MARMGQKGNKMNKLGIAFFGVLVLFGIIIGRGIIREQTRDAGSDKPVVKIGVIAPLTGNLATQVPAVLDAMQLALADAVPENSKYNYRIIAEDAGASARAVMAYQKFTSLDKIDVLVSVLSLNASPLRERIVQDKINMVFIGWPEQWISENPYAFAFYTPLPHTAQKYAEAARAKGIKRIGIVAHTMAAHEYMIPLLEKELERAGVSIVYLKKANMEERDFRMMIAELMQKPVDTLLPLMLEPGLTIFAKQMQEKGFKVPLSSVDQLLFSAQPKNFDGAWIIIGEVATPQFQQYFKDKTGKDVHIHAGGAYDSIRVLVDAIERAEVPTDQTKPTTETIRAALLNVKDFDGVTGRFSIGADGLTDKQPHLGTIQNGQFVPQNASEGH
jgi:ABC-type branched-subunit amino acid transport system substrate-binding protein